MKRVVLDSYEEPVRDYKRFVGRTRKRAKDGRVLGECSELKLDETLYS